MCIRTGVTCPGYRDPLTLIFRVENQKVSHKVQASETDEKRVVDRTTGDFMSNQCVWPACEDNRLAIHITHTLEDRAIGFFATNYVLDGFLNYLSMAYNTWPASAALSESIISLGIAGLSNTEKSSEGMCEARRRYAIALRLTNTALADPTQVKTDQILMAVLLLALFEVRFMFKASTYALKHID